MTSRRLAAAALAVAAVATAGVARVVAYQPAARPTGLAAPTPPAAATATPSATPSPGPSPAASPGPRAVPPAHPYPLPAQPAYPPGCPVPPRRGGSPYQRWQPPVTVPEAALPAPVAVPRRTVDLAPVTGKGMWIYLVERTEGGDAAAIVRKAKALGLRQVWVRTGSSRQGFYAAELLDALLPRAHAAGIAVMGWDFPYLHDPVADAVRAAAALNHVAPGGHRIDGFSPDIETAGEGTIASARRAQVYLSRVAVAAGDRPVVATVPRVTPKRIAEFPYRAIAPYVDAFAPMVYWSCKEPGQLAAENLRFLSRLKPVHLIGQAYDMGVEGGRRGDPRGRELWRFLDVGHREGAVGVSFYVWHTSTAEQQRAVAAFPWTKG